ncbi:MAG: hypothetical protein Q9225_003061 [Loekoesia sp. 1 TL-2023]
MSLKSSKNDQSNDKRVIEESENDSTNDDVAAAEAVALRKVDWHILPLVFLYYMVSFLDRSNIGNGRLYGLEEDLGLKGNQFQTATSVFFATYVACEVPSAIFLKKLRPARFISGISTLWGIVASLTGLTRNYGSLLACRLLLGLAEGPLFPCLIVYFTFFYTRKELAVRFGYLISGAAVSGASVEMVDLHSPHSLKGPSDLLLRRLLIIEGIPSVCLGVFGWFFLADSPQSAWYLSKSERQLLVLRSARDQQEASTPSAQILHRSDVLAAFKDWKIWAFCLLNFPGDIQLFSYSIFLPTIIKAVNPAWSTLYVQALTVPCYARSAIVYFIMAFISDAIQRRALFGILGCVASITGHIMLIAGQGVAARFAGCFVIATGIFTVSGLALAWMPTNLPRYGKRSTAVGMQLMIGNSAGVAAPYLYPTNDSPRFTMGHSVTIALLVLSAVVSGILWWSMARINKRRIAGDEDGKVLGMTEEQINDLGDESPRYIYAT